MFENKTAAEIKSTLDSDPKLKAKAITAVELMEAFKTLSAEKQIIVVESIKEKYPDVANALKGL